MTVRTAGYAIIYRHDSLYIDTVTGNQLVIRPHLTSNIAVSAGVHVTVRFSYICLFYNQLAGFISQLHDLIDYNTSF